MRHGSLFSGIGGFDLAAEWMGWENIFHCEWNEFGQKVLKHYWPNAITYEDITKTDFNVHRGDIDILTGGFPCQPYSTAGKRKGKEDNRHLWPQMCRAITEIQPRWVVGENVYGLLNWNGGLVLTEIKADLEAAGFEVFPPLVLPACGINAPHKRDRVWIIAHSYKRKHNRTSRQDERTGQQERLQERDEMEFADKSGGLREFFTNSNEVGFCNQERIRKMEGDFGFSFSSINNTWEKFPTQSPICNGDDGLPTRLDIDTISKNKWRKESLMAGGNAVVPQIVFEIFKAIEKMNIEQELERSVATNLNQGTKAD